MTTVRRIAHRLVVLLLRGSTMKTDSIGRRKRRFKRYIPIYIMSLPGLIYLFINNYMPLPGLILAFKKYNARKGIFGSKWIGFRNFKFLFATKDAFIITRNTILYNLAFILIGTVLAIIVAIILADMTSRLKRFYQSVILMPFMLSMVIVSYLVFAFLSTENGYLNNTILRRIGREPVLWYMEPKYWPFILIFVHIWKGIGYSCIIYLSTILGIDKGYYEAASIDGCSKLRQITSITLPLLRPTIIMMTMLAIGRIFYSDFGLFYQVPQNSGALYTVTNTIDTYVSRSPLRPDSISPLSALSSFSSVIFLSAGLTVTVHCFEEADPT